MAGCDSDSGDRSQGRMALVQQIQPALPPELEQTAPVQPRGARQGWRLRGGLARARGHFCPRGSPRGTDTQNTFVCRTDLQSRDGSLSEAAESRPLF